MPERIMCGVAETGGRRCFHDDQDREMFLATLAQVARQSGLRVHRYVSMSNHHHLLVETSDPNLSAAMKWFQGTCMQRFNVRHRLSGHLFRASMLGCWVKSQCVVGDDWIIRQIGMGHLSNLSGAVSALDPLPTKEYRKLRRRLHVCTD